jgi:hypothetical protein
MLGGRKRASNRQSCRSLGSPEDAATPFGWCGPVASRGRMTRREEGVQEPFASQGYSRSGSLCDLHRNSALMQQVRPSNPEPFGTVALWESPQLAPVAYVRFRALRAHSGPTGNGCSGSGAAGHSAAYAFRPLPSFRRISPVSHFGIRPERTSLSPNTAQSEIAKP